MSDDEILIESQEESTYKIPKIAKRYEEPNLILIENRTPDNKKRNYIQIYQDYKRCIEGGYDLSADDIANYLNCSYQYVVKFLTEKIKHVRINSVSRSCIFLYIRLHEEWLDEKTISLYNKRLLFSRTDFYNYIKSQTVVSQQYKTFTYYDFNYEIIKKINKNIDVFNSKQEEDFMKIKRASILFSKVIDKISIEHKSKEIHLQENDYLPERWHSMKSLKQEFGFNYNIDVYRFVESYGLKRYLICNTFARYDATEIENIMNDTDSKFDVIKMDYVSWLECVDAYDGFDKLIKHIENETYKLSCQIIK